MREAAPTDDDLDDADPAEERAVWRREIVAELAEIGLELARRLAAGVKAAGEAISPEEAAVHALAFSRIARAVRLTVALSAKLDAEDEAEPVEAKPDPEAARLAALKKLVGTTQADLEVSRVQHRRQRAGDVIDRMIEASARERGDGWDRERLRADLTERLSDEDEFEDFSSLPFTELVLRICEDLGVTPDMSLLEDADRANPPYVRPSDVCEPPPGGWPRGMIPRAPSWSARPLGAKPPPSSWRWRPSAPSG
jgi:hypothetical protein